MGSIWVILVIVILVYVWNMQYTDIKCKKYFLDDVIFKTGDIILFKAYNNYNSIFIGNYFGHMGIVLRDPDTHELMIFEANGIENMPLKPHHNKNGVFYSKLEDRIRKYKGRVFVKQLEKSVKPEDEIALKEFVVFATQNMQYEKNIFRAVMHRYFSGSKCNFRTNCGEIVFLSLIKLGLLDLDEYDTPTIHYLKWMCKLRYVNMNRYLDPIELIDHPFDS